MRWLLAARFIGPEDLKILGVEDGLATSKDRIRPRNDSTGKSRTPGACRLPARASAA